MCKGTPKGVFKYASNLNLMGETYFLMRNCCNIHDIYIQENWMYMHMYWWVFLFLSPPCVCSLMRCDVFPVSPGGAQAEGAGEERPVGSGEWQDAETHPGVTCQHGPPPHFVPDWPHRRPADTAGGSGSVTVRLYKNAKTRGNKTLFISMLKISGHFFLSRTQHVDNGRIITIT